MSDTHQWYPVPGEHGPDVLLITDGRGYLRRDGDGWSRADATGAPIDGDLPTEVVIHSPGGTLSHVRPVRRDGPRVNLNRTWISEDR